MITNILTKNTYKYNPERDEKIIELRKQGYTYREIGEMFTPPVTKQAVYLAVKNYEKRMGTKKADA